MNDYGWSYLTRRDKRAILSGVRDGTARGGPFHVEIHPSSRCGLRCFFCSTHAWRKREDLPLAAIEALGTEMRALGTRSVCLSGGGEPLSHPQALEVIHALAERGVPVSHLTTNGQRLGPEIARALLETGCSEVIVSLNCGDETSYAAMMQTSPAVFRQVIRNIAGLLAMRLARGARKPALILQFLIYKHNFETVPAMYALASSLGVDGVIFNGLSFLPSEMRMTPDETDVMVGHLEDVMLRDEYRRVLGIGSSEQDVSGIVSRIETRVGDARVRMSRLERLRATFARTDFTLRQKWNHHWKMRRLAEARRLLDRNIDPCIRPWYSMTVRTDGTIPVCCARQELIMADLDRASLSEIWFGPRFERLRRGMRRAIVRGTAWKENPASDSGVTLRCSAASTGIERCPFRSFYFRQDLRFFRRLGTLTGSETQIRAVPRHQRQSGCQASRTTSRG